MSEGPLDLQQLLQSRINAQKNLFNKGRGGRASADKLTQLAAKRNADSLQFTHLMLKTRLANDLEETIASYLDDHPELRDQIFIGIITDEGFGVEVVAKETAIAAVEDATAEDARSALSQNPVGFFERANFTLKTPANDAHRGLQKQLEKYFERSGKK